MTNPTPERTVLAPGLEISRIVTGLWQVADMERSGTPLDPEASAKAMADYAAAGFDTFDMADHYGSAEVITGHYLTAIASKRFAAGPNGKPQAFTKWCPTPGPMTADVVRAGVERSLRRMQVDAIDLLQFHWWTFDHLDYIEALEGLEVLRTEGLIRNLGVTNFDTDHLRVAVKHGIPVATNQVSFSLLDRRASGAMSALCQETGVRLLAYGTLGGGFLSDRWLGQPKPANLPDWSKSKYKRFIDVMGGWQVFQGLLETLAAIGKKHGVSADDLTRLHQFSADPKFCAGKFPIASDADTKIAQSYALNVTPPRAGAKDVNQIEINHAFIERVTYVIGKDNKVLAALSSKEDDLSPEEHVEKSLSMVQKLKSK